MEQEVGSFNNNIPLRPAQRKNYLIMFIIALLNIIFPFWGFYIAIVIAPCLLSGVAIFMPIIVGLAITYYSFVGIKEWNWPKDRYTYGMMFAGLFVIIEYIVLLLLFAIAFSQIP